MKRKGGRKAKNPPWDTADPSGMGALVVGFLEWMRFKGFSPDTLRTVNNPLWLFAQWLKDRGITRPRDVTKMMVERYQRYLIHYRKEDNAPLANRGIRARLTAVKAFFRWLTKNNHLLANPAADMEMPKVGLRLPKHVLSVKDVESILSQPDIQKTNGLRDRAILETFYSTGIRRKELSRLKILDVDMDRGTIMISEGKGMRDRLIPIGERALAWIRKYLDDSRPHLAVEPDEGILFLTKDGKRFRAESLTPLVRTYVKAAKIGNGGSCHMFRHTMATLMLEGGADIRYIQQMLGHARLESTETYTRVSMRKLKKVFQATHPGAALKRKTKARPERESSPEDLFSCLATEEKEEETEE